MLSLAKQTQLTTRLAQAGTRYDKATGAISVPIYQTASFVHPGLGQSTGFDYSRSSNPTRLVLEETLALADGGHRGFAFASGLAAIDVDTSDTAAVELALAIPRVRGVLIESPTNPILRIADIRAIASLARTRGILTIVDNTFLTPVLQRPIEQGADLVVYSATKYLAGHNDVVAGAVVTASPELSERIGFLQNASGGILGPQDSWLTLRGLKTLTLRVERQQANALAIATWLAKHPRVRRVYYPGLPNHPGRDILLREKSGWGGMISFEVDDPARVAAILANVKIFLFAESLGGVESLITYPSVQTHADIEEATRHRLGINDRLLRLSVGIEDVADLLDDLETVL
jgi:cystathionine beta-lyase/cystathionine gamma-synthase